ncbi:MAG: hypothetical protein LBN98_03110 [Prevotellaceae bacterium]|jgi:hypothetical protein|nr:hypothetical protein [Prevotellaceae bacterium]
MKFFEKKGNVFGLAAAVWLLLWVGMEITLRWAAPQYNYALAACRYIPALFLIFLLVFTGLVGRWEKKLQEGSLTPAHVGNYFLIWKMSKLVVALLLFFFCYLTMEASVFRAFLLLFLLFYLVFMIMETFTLRSIERRYKHSKEK